MRVFVYEFITGGGLLSTGDTPPAGSLLAEGLAMARALVADFSALLEVKVSALRDARLPQFHLPRCDVTTVASAAEEQTQFLELAQAADWTVLIAPEIGGALLERAQMAEEAGARLLSPSSMFVALAGDKHRIAEHLRRWGVPAPCGIALSSGDFLPRDFDYPAVLKPRDGAGSLGVQLVERWRPAWPPAGIIASSRLERFCPGMPVSVAALCGPGDSYLLPPCRQHLSTDGQFQYLGGSLPLPSPLTARAQRLAHQALASLPPTIGYLGIDMVLAGNGDASGDTLIEINPRLTTSYVGLRAALPQNLAQAMLEMGTGLEPSLGFNKNQPVLRAVEFDANGMVRRLAEVKSGGGL